MAFGGQLGVAWKLGCCVLTLVIYVVGPGSWLQTASTAPKAANSAAEEDISGMYSFERDGEFIQITVEPAEPMKAPAVSGFISRYGDDDSDRGVFLDHFISKGSLDKAESQLRRTKPVHGVFYEFAGTVDHGSSEDAR